MLTVHEPAEWCRNQTNIPPSGRGRTSSTAMSRRVGLASAVALLLSNSAASPGGGGDGNAAHAASCDASADPHLVSARQKEQGGWRRDGYQSAIGLFNKSVETSNDPEAHHSLAFFRATGLGAPALPHDDAAAVAHEAAASRAGLASALMAMVRVSTVSRATPRSARPLTHPPARPHTGLPLPPRIGRARGLRERTRALPCSGGRADGPRRRRSPGRYVNAAV